MTAGLQGSGAEARQNFAGFAVGHGRYVADGEDAGMILYLQVRTYRDAPAMYQLNAQGVDDWIGLEKRPPRLALASGPLLRLIDRYWSDQTLVTPVPVCTSTPRSSSAFLA